MYSTSTPAACTGFIASLTALRLASFTLGAVADHCTVPSATSPDCETRWLWNGVTTTETCGIAVILAIAVSIAVSTAGSVTFALPWVAKTIMLCPPLNAGSFVVRTAAAFCDSVPGIVNVSLVLPPLACAITMAATAAASQAARTSRRRRNAKQAIRYK